MEFLILWFASAAVVAVVVALTRYCILLAHVIASLGAGLCALGGGSPFAQVLAFMTLLVIGIAWLWSKSRPGCIAEPSSIPESSSESPPKNKNSRD